MNQLLIDREIESVETIEKPINEFLEPLLGKTFKCLDQGFVRLVDYMGNEGSVVQAARISYGKGTKSLSEDVTLLRYLMRKQHTTPFEQVSLKFHCRMPMDAWRQGVRNRTAKVNEYSTRYSEAIDARQETSSGDWRLQSDMNKQGSKEGELSWPEELEFERTMGTKNPGEYLSLREHELHELSVQVYEERLKFGIAKEQARKDLPLSTYTEFYWKWDLHNLLNHFLALRMDPHAQKEIREYAEVIGAIVQAGFPNIWEAFEDFHPLRGAILFTRQELAVLSKVSYNSKSENMMETFEQILATESGSQYVSSLLSKREISDFKLKLSKMTIQ